MKTEAKGAIGGALAGAALVGAYVFHSAAEKVRPDPTNFYPIPHTPFSIDYLGLQQSLYAASWISLGIGVASAIFVLSQLTGRKQRDYSPDDVDLV